MTQKTDEVVCTVINKQLAYFDGYIISNPFELGKAYVLARAEGKLSKFLPYSRGYWLPSDDPNICKQGWDLDHWIDLLSDDNCPGKVKFTKNPKLFRQLVEPLDFGKPFDRGLVMNIRAQFDAGVARIASIDAAEIEENFNE